MLKKFKDFGKFKEYYDLRSLECKIGIIVVLIIFFIFKQIDLYKNFNLYKEPLQNITIYIAAGLIGLLGVILAGIALLLGILDKEFRNNLEKVYDKSLLEDFMVSFQFIIFNIGIAICVFFSLYFSIFINIYINESIFYGIILLSIYLFVFIIFYVISLTSESINLYLYKSDFEKEFYDKNFYDYLNEFRIDYLIKKTGVKSPETLVKDIEKIIDDSSLDECKKEKLKEYIKSYYIP